MLQEGVTQALKALGQVGEEASVGKAVVTGVGGSGSAGEEATSDEALDQARREAQREALTQWLPPREESVHDEVLDFYAGRDWTPAWVTSTEGRARARALIGSACRVSAEGLDPSPWSIDAALTRLDALEQTPGEDPVASAVETELVLTESFLRMVDDVRKGQRDPLAVRWHIPREDGPRASPHRILQTLTDPQLAPEGTEPVEMPLVRALRPEDPQYARLLKARRMLEAVREKGGWPEVSPGKILKPGDEDPRVVELRRRLAASGELRRGPDGKAEVESPLFDDALSEALKQFQRKHGLAEDGMVGTTTLVSLREPVEAQLERIAVNLERLRWLPYPIEGRHLVVNVPDYMLEARDGGRTLFSTRVVVGEPGWQTPLMVSNVVRVVVNPNWTVPPRIMREKIFPRYQASPERASHFPLRVVDRETGEEVDPLTVDWEQAEPDQFRFVQQPGPDNPMGSVKLAMDNHLMIFLHGTPDPEAFELAQRAISHGCVRVQALDEVTRFALPEESHDRYAQARESRRETTLELDAPLPVCFVYFTAWVDDDGTLQQRPDVYGQDARLAKAMRTTDEGPQACR